MIADLLPDPPSFDFVVKTVALFAATILITLAVRRWGKNK